MQTMTVMAGGLRYPEGPVAMADGSVLLVEMERGTLTRVRADGSLEIAARTGGGPNGVAIGPDGAAYICNNGGFAWTEKPGLLIPAGRTTDYAGGSIQRVDLATGKVTTLYDRCDDVRLKAPNDIAFDTCGGFWFTDSGLMDNEGLRYGGLYYGKSDGSEIRKVRGHIVGANGVGFSPDEKTLYVSETLAGRLWAFDVVRPGEVAPSPMPFAPARIVQTLPGFQLLDSLAVEQSGKICVATMINGGITVFDPDGTTEHHAIPDMLVTNICFGGADLRDAWITCGSTGKLLRCRWPRPGLRLPFV